MATIAYGLIAFCIAALVVHLATIIIVCRRVSRASAPNAGLSWPPVTIIRPVRGLDAIERATLASTFALATADTEILFCCATSDDPVVPYLRQLLQQHDHVNARLLIGEDRKSHNPKLDNVRKGWRAASHDWVIMADSNLRLPSDYIARVFMGWTSDAGVVCAPPIGANPESFAAEVECAFLNTYQARWQYTADALGFGFAQGKTMLWRRSELENWGGISALRSEIAEDAAATKIVRAAGRQVRLADPSFEQPLGHRTSRQIWDRQLRWAQLRRASFPMYFAAEIFTGMMPPLIAASTALLLNAISPDWLAFGVLVWLLAEGILSSMAGWHLNWRSPVAWIIRDAMIAPIWLSAWVTQNYDWRGNDIATSQAAIEKQESSALTVSR